MDMVLWGLRRFHSLPCHGQILNEVVAVQGSYAPQEWGTHLDSLHMNTDGTELIPGLLWEVIYPFLSLFNSKLSMK